MILEDLSLSKVLKMYRAPSFAKHFLLKKFI
uniref:Uncharacterized protein MANES_S053700 n=1 Tax=Rhizophora mucronata TaxID=61149 RepID=A0A2P2MW60_RHIMU